MNFSVTKLYRKYDNNIFWRIIYVLFLSGPPSLSTIMTNQSVHLFFKDNLGVMLFLTPDNPIKIIILALWVPIITATMHCLGVYAKRDYYYLNQQGTAAIMTAIEEIVAEKSERIGKAVKSGDFNRLEKCFAPDEQIQIIITQLYYCLKELNNTTNELAVRLWRVESNKVKDLIHHMPQTATNLLTSASLHEVESEFKKVLSTRRPSITENSLKDDKFSKIDECKECHGCNVFTIPIIDDKTNQLYSILQIRYKFVNTDAPVYLTKNKKKHLVVLEKFVRRLQFEHRVLFLYRGKNYVA